MKSSAALLMFIIFFQAEDGIRDIGVTGVQTCALPICCWTVKPGNTDPTGLVYPAPMPAFICAACGTQYPPSEAPPGACPVCTDERQFEIGRASCRERV